MNNTHPPCFFLDVNLEQTTDTFISIILTCILNAVFSLATCCGNCVILHAIRKTQELHSPSFILLFNLALSDLLVGLICQPLFVAYHIAEFADNFRVYCTFRVSQVISAYITTGISLCTLSAVSFDRLLALTLHLRYHTVITVHSVFQTVLILWMSAIAVVISKFWMPWNKWVIFPFVICITASLVTTLSALKIVQIVRRHQRQINQQQQSVQRHTVNVIKSRKSAVTVLYVYGLFLIFYLPFLATLCAESFIGYTLTAKITNDYVTTVGFMNSCLNPFVYLWRIRKIGRAVKRTLTRN